LDALTFLNWAFDYLTGLALLVLAFWALGSPRLFRGIVMFVAFGLMMSVAWVRLDAPDIALAEIAIGAGLTGALLLAALARLTAAKAAKDDVSNPGKQRRTPRIFYYALTLLLAMVASGLAYSVVTLPSVSPGLSTEVAASIDLSGVSNPVTAVLLNFRGYDTLLELLVLLLALIGVWTLGTPSGQRVAPAGMVLDTLTRVLTPALLLLSTYLLWIGARAPGGAFQAGAILAAAGVLLMLAGWRPHPRFADIPLRLALVAGPVLFLTFALMTMASGQNLMEYPHQRAGILIFVLEALATLSIGVTLASLFLGGQPRNGQNQ
jgi:multisubunit Na+/H+ antiporter MnhB subunit